MQKTFVLAILFCFASATAAVNAQSINNKNWKAYIEAPINDTVTFHIYSDSSFVTNSQGEVKVQNRCNVAGDTLTILDRGTEEMGCTGVKGVYKISQSGNSFTLTLINDPCDGRSYALAGRKWVQVSK